MLLKLKFNFISLIYQVFIETLGFGQISRIYI